MTVMTFAIHDGFITEIRSVTNPPQLAPIVPSWAV
jgi:hypothetical protein